MTSWGRRAVGAVGATLLVVVPVGCGTEKVAGASPMTPGAAVAELSQWWGTPEDHQAAEVVVAHRMNGAYDACLDGAGYPRLDWRGSIFPAGWDTPLGASALMVDEQTRMFSDDLDTRAASAAVEHAMNNPPERSAAEVAAEHACLDEVRDEQPGDDEIDRLRAPSSLLVLREQWNEALAGAHDELSSYDELTACVDAQELPEMRGRSVTRVAHLADRIERELGIVTGSEETVAEFREWEQSVVDAIVTCVEPRRDEALALLGDLVGDFHDDHVEEVAQLRTHWSDVRAEAEVLGWSPDDPYAGHQR